MGIRTSARMGTPVQYVVNGVVEREAIAGGGYETIDDGGGHNLSFLGKYDCGGPCRITKSVTTVKPSVVPTGVLKGTHIFPPSSIGELGSAGTTPSEASLRGSGTTAIARTTPTSPSFNMLTSMGEVVKDGIPTAVGVQTWREQAKVYRGLSSEYLNYEFGWKPLVSDVQNFARTVQNQNKILRDFEKGSGKTTRVSYYFPVSSDFVAATRDVNVRDARAVALGSFRASVVGSMERKTWFKGAFTYHIPVGDSARAKAARFESYANHLLGVRLTPEVLWNLAPWSWAVDWFSNTGDIIHNVSTIGQDSLTLMYGYIMFRRERSTAVSVIEGSATRPSGSFASSRELDFLRLPASPYSGFDTSATLTATQTAILAALGMNRVR